MYEPELLTGDRGVPQLQADALAPADHDLGPFEREDPTLVGARSNDEVGHRAGSARDVDAVGHRRRAGAVVGDVHDDRGPRLAGEPADLPQTIAESVPKAFVRSVDDLGFGLLTLSQLRSQLPPIPPALPMLGCVRFAPRGCRGHFAGLC
jgi:hypothetical protein